MLITILTLFFNKFLSNFVNSIPKSVILQNDTTLSSGFISFSDNDFRICFFFNFFPSTIFDKFGPWILCLKPELNLVWDMLVYVDYDSCSYFFKIVAVWIILDKFDLKIHGYLNWLKLGAEAITVVVYRIFLYAKWFELNLR